jgi:biopolymer transport protein ExbB
MGVLELVLAGGPFMWPIILCSIIAAGIIVERIWTLQQRRVMPPDLTRRIWALVEAGQANDKVIAALEVNSPLGKLLATGLANRHRPRAVLMERLEDAGRHVAHDLDRFINTLGTIAGVAPLLGLLGTVTGIIKAFEAIHSQGLGDPRILSGGISEALLTTAAGLLVAIPSQVAYRYLRGRVDSTVVQIEKDVLRFAEALNDRADLRRQQEEA